jgi:type I restriction-modification system DNA methylase subunit
LLPEATLERAWRDVPAFTLVTNPRWENFKHLFRSIDKGNPSANISAFNGGLFEKDPKVDDLHLDDQWTTFFREIGTYDFKDEVSVDVLGHLFEQSITDLEALRSDPDAPPAPEKKKTAGKRKREGVYYTPAFITQFIVRETIGPCLREKFGELAIKLGVDPLARVEDRDPKKWRAYQLGRWDILSKLRVCDPACGSGAFLIQALDYLDDWYADVVGELSVFNDIDVDAWEAKINPTILRENLFGVDLSPEAVEITALSLWIRTAERGKTLADLSHNIQCGNSVVSDPAVHPKAFNWQAAFPEVFDQGGGFDVVIGNPPYVRQELLTAFKPHWETRFSNVFSGTSDIYVYFYALGSDLLRPKGRLAFISSSGFARANFAENLRRFLAEQMQFEQFIDLGDTQIFADAKDVYPAIVVLSKPVAAKGTSSSSVRALRLRRADDPEQIDELIAHSGRNTVVATLSRRLAV